MTLISSGSFVPGLTFLGANAGMILTAPTGRWRRYDGDLVYVTLRLFVMNKGISIGTAEVTDLPFPSADDYMDYPLTASWKKINLASGFTRVTAFVERGDNKISLQQDGDNQTYKEIGSADFTSGQSRLDIAGWYIAQPLV